MHTRTFYLPGNEVQLLLAGAGRSITARVIANLALAQHGREFSDMIAGELLRSGARTDKLPPDANEKWPGHSFGFRLRLNVDQIGWTPAVLGKGAD